MSYQLQYGNLAWCREHIQKLQSELNELKSTPQTIADTFRECYSSSYLRGDEVAKIIERRFGQGMTGTSSEESKS